MNTSDFIKKNLIDSFIQKGKQSAKIGEIRMYDGKPYQKQADGRWLRHHGSDSEPKKEEPKKDSLIGREITYTKKYAYGKEGQVTAKVVAVKPDGKVLLSSGDETHTSIIKLKDEKESKNYTESLVGKDLEIVTGSQTLGLKPKSIDELNSKLDELIDHNVKNRELLLNYISDKELKSEYNHLFSKVKKDISSELEKFIEIKSGRGTFSPNTTILSFKREGVEAIKEKIDKSIYEKASRKLKENMDYFIQEELE